MSKKLKVDAVGTDGCKVTVAEKRELGMEKALAKLGKRIVKMADVTVTKEMLTFAVRKSGKLPGNEIPAFVEFLLKEIIMS